ncbi:MAG: FAD-dependent oxidoreductase [Acidobacteria bacterium]|nr:MAG: FAD-dependent oxidoreductase [Acidobacteriota bacterium]
MAPDAIVIGAGPNGLAAAIALARAGRTVVVYEAQDGIGGGCRSDALTLPGFVHDVCSAVHPMAVASPFFRTLPLSQHGLEWIEPPAMLAHPFDGGTRAAIIERSLPETAAALGLDEGAYRRAIGSVASAWPLIEDAILGPPKLPRHPLAMARFGLSAMQSAERLATHEFQGERARGLFAGIAAHAMLPLEMIPTGAVALVLGAMTHTAGWLFPRGGAQRLADALASYLRSLGGEIVTNARVNTIEELPSAKAILCDLSPRPFLRIAGRVLPGKYKRKLEHYRYGMAAYKVDWALDGPIPWQDPAVGRAGTVHLGGTLQEIAASERDAWNGRESERPFVLLAQQSLFDPTRAPEGQHTAWTYCHVPNGSVANMLPRIEHQIERFAPGFRDRVLARHVTTPADLEQRNPNLAGGDIGMGVMDLRQTFRRPTWGWYRTPRRGLYLCSASTPPGVGVHGMCGFFAAQCALRDVLT